MSLGNLSQKVVTVTTFPIFPVERLRDFGKPRLQRAPSRHLRAREDSRANIVHSTSPSKGSQRWRVCLRGVVRYPPCLKLSHAGYFG